MQIGGGPPDAPVYDTRDIPLSMEEAEEILRKSFLIISHLLYTLINHKFETIF